MKTSSNVLFMSMMIISTISVLNSSNWLNMWLCLEMNMMSFIPLMSNHKNMYTSQSMMMYFLIQSMSSMMFISIILINMYFLKNQELIESMITIMMMIKMGMSPMHLWFIQIMNKMSWTMCLLLMTWQKMAPMYIMSSTISLNKTTTIMICLSTLTGAIMGLNQTSTQKIIAYSSVNHLGWMMACCACNKKSWLMYMMLYSMIMMLMCSIMYKHNILYMNQMNNMFSSQIMNKILIITLMLSLGGVPPFLGFLPKWLCIQYMISSKEILTLLLMVMSSLITLFYYMRMISSMSLMLSHSQKWMILPPTMMMTSTLILMNNMLPSMILILNMF